MSNVVNLQEWRNRPKQKPVLTMPKTLSEMAPVHLATAELVAEIAKVQDRLDALRASVPTLRTVMEREKAVVAMIPLGDKLNHLKTLLTKRMGW